VTIDPTITVGNIIEIIVIFGGGVLFLWRMHKANRQRLDSIQEAVSVSTQDRKHLHERLDNIEKTLRDSLEAETLRLDHLDECVDTVKQAVNKVQNAFDLVWEWFKDGSYYRKKDQ
jgi:hypothetical protein